MEKFELHLHTLGHSPCAKVDAKEIPGLFINNGYHGIVVTDHYMKWLFDCYYESGTLRQKVLRFLDGYQRVREYGQDLGLKVYLGAEVNPARYNRDLSHPAYEFLLYGLTEDFLLEHAELYNLSQEELFELCDSSGILMIQSHPFRTRTFLADYRYMHGVEVFNGNPRHNSFSEVAAAFQKAHQMIGTSGGDFHELGDENRGGVYFSRPVDGLNDVTQCLKNGDFTLFTGKSENRKGV